MELLFQCVVLPCLILKCQFVSKARILLTGQQAVPYGVSSDNAAFPERRETTVKGKEKVLFSAVKRDESE